MKRSRLPHGYTNQTRLVENFVEKVYEEPNAATHARAELACLTALHGVLPVAVVIDSDLSIPFVRMTHVAGAHGQDLIDAGNARAVLRLVGSALAALQALPPVTVPELVGDGPVIVHGDFGPQNMLFDLARDDVTAILDWESTHRGNRIEDLAWSEWIVRMHHPRAVDALDELFDAAGARPSWSVRHAAMLDRVQALTALCETSRRKSEWPARLDATARWSE